MGSFPFRGGCSQFSICSLFSHEATVSTPTIFVKVESLRLFETAYSRSQHNIVRFVYPSRELFIVMGLGTTDGIDCWHEGRIEFRCVL